MNDLPEASDSNGTTELETLEYLRGVKSSTCLLLTPSPTTLDFKHPLSEEMGDNAFLALNDDTKSINIGNSEASAGDSSSSGDSNSVAQDPVSAQLINNISMLDYQTLSKNGDIILGQPESKLNGSLSVNNRKLPNFVNWNWPLIRNIILWIVLSALIACLAAIVTMVVTIPKTCNPNLPWHQGKVFYEVFPASFKDSNNDGFGDLKGLIKKLDYIKELGGSTIRLNYIFESQDYPVHFYNTTNTLKIDRSLGVLKDFQDLVSAVHKLNMHIILDIPVSSLIVIEPFPISNRSVLAHNETTSDLDITTKSILFWACEQNVDGLYLKNLEMFTADDNFGKSLQIWKELIGSDKIFMASEAALLKAKGSSLTVLLNRIDLIDIHIDLNNGVKRLKDRIESVTSGILWEKPHYPWVHWNIGNINSQRISSKTTNNTLASIALEMALPGAVGIFYGDEIGLGSLERYGIESDFHEHEHVHNLATMSFPENDKTETGAILPWNHESIKKPMYEYLNTIKHLIQVRLDTPTIYLRGIYKEGNVLKNIDVRKTVDNLVVIERWFPRRNTCVFVGNFGNQAITTDLSSMFYGGVVVGATNSSLVGTSLYFDKVTFSPNSALIIKLEK
ncbi:uncharacterized protein LOC125055523 [Pieris napi]|uniref:uncharacterized protein LOC125055523 n=1 Tax=Pieris napi TaxID=78633 RepID=UPI001FB9A301|nr:uncharacterized protein LOC125055523 [Pieris napi]